MKPGLILVILCILEVLFATFLINTLGPYVSSLLLFSVSVGIGFVFLRIAGGKTDEAAQPVNVKPLAWVPVVQWVLFAAAAWFIIAQLKHIWWYELTYHTDKGSSDVIPQITTLVQRFLHGEQPYYPIPFKDYTLYPTYLPLQWLPYIPLELAHKDYRWVPTIAMMLAAFYYFLTHRKREGNVFSQLLLPVWPLVVWGAFILHASEMFVFAVEGLIAAYYFAVAESLKKNNVWLIGLTAAVCLLSRYSIVLWLPLCVALYWLAGQRRQALIVTGISAVLIVVLYWWPFLRLNPDIFINGYNYHTRAAYAQWMQDLNHNNGEVYLYNGLGFTPYALKLLPGDEGNILMWYKRIHIGMCLLTLAMLAWGYVRGRKRYALNDYLLFSFKIYLTVFYVFIQIPYKYLYLVPIFLSVSLLGRAMRHRPVKETQTLAP